MFVFEEESIFCESCYEKKFAKTCHSCRRPIVGVSGAAPVISGLNSFMYNMYFVLHTHTHTHTLQLHKVIDAHCMIIPISAHSLCLPLSPSPCITAQDLSWHQEHFVCSRCNTDLSQGGYTVHNNRDTVCVHVCLLYVCVKALACAVYTFLNSPSPPLSPSLALSFLPSPLSPSLTLSPPLSPSLTLSHPLSLSPPLPPSLPPSPLSLSGEGFNMEAGQLFCGGCYGESYGATCGGCGSKIGGDQLWVEALDQQWHSHCFTCTVSE